jgi:hypothetical protein
MQAPQSLAVPDGQSLFCSSCWMQRFDVMNGKFGSTHTERRSEYMHGDSHVPLCFSCSLKRN